MYCRVFIATLMILALTACGGGAGEGDKHAPVKPFPRAETRSVSITAPARVTAGKGGYTASVPGQSGWSYAWRIDQDNGRILDGAGTREVTFEAGAAGETRLLCTITDAAGVAVQAAPAVCAILPLPPRPVIHGPGEITEHAPGGAAWVDPQDGCGYAWSVSGGTLTAGGDSPRVTYQAGPAGRLSLTCRVANALGDSDPRPAERDITVLPAPQRPVLTPPAAIEANRPGCTVSAAPRPGITHEWTLAGGTATSPLTGDQLVFTAGPSGTVTLSCVARNALGAVSAPAALTCAIVPLPERPVV